VRDFEEELRLYCQHTHAHIVEVDYRGMNALFESEDHSNPSGRNPGNRRWYRFF
jgi:hypothetical protein